MLTAMSTRVGHDPDRPDRVLGTDGLCNHGRFAGSEDSDADFPADTVRCLVQGKGGLSS